MIKEKKNLIIFISILLIGIFMLFVIMQKKETAVCENGMMTNVNSKDIQKNYGVDVAFIEDAVAEYPLQKRIVHQMHGQHLVAHTLFTSMKNMLYYI